ncbi:HlyC/CorC family transporter [bacterium]|nr:HlyC/CorC family transporter [bacterium]
MTTVLIIAVIFCLMGCFFCAGSEIALLSVDRSYVKSCLGKKTGAVATYKLITTMSLTLSCILLGTNLFNTMTSALFTPLMDSMRTALKLPESISTSLLTTLIATPAMLVFGEVVPKAIGLNDPASFSFKAAPALLFFRNILKPVLIVLDWITSLIAKPLGGKGGGQIVAKEEVEAMTSMGREEGALTDEECLLIKRAMDLTQQTIASVMTPIIELHCFPATMTVGDFLDLSADKNEAIFPVYDERPENVEGVMYKSLALKAIMLDPKAEFKPLSEVMYKDINFVPELLSADTIIRDLRKQGAKLAFAVDEFGAVTGMVTPIDVAEEIVGTMFDMTPRYVLHKNPDGSVECDGRADAEKVGEALNVIFDRKGYDTIGGLIMKLASKVPESGEIYTQGKVKFTVISATPRRISRVKVEIDKSNAK